MPAAVEGVKIKRRNLRTKFEDYVQGRKDRETSFYGSDCKALRKEMGYTVPQMAKLLACSVSIIAGKECRNGKFGVKLRAKLNKIKRLVDAARADLRDRYEMPDFRK